MFMSGCHHSQQGAAASMKQYPFWHGCHMRRQRQAEAVWLWTGLAACAGSSLGLQRIYDIKRRPSGLPLGVCVSDVADVETYGATAHLPAGLLEAVLPGPVTLILPRQPAAPLSPLLNPGLPSLGETPPPPSPAVVCLCAGS